MRWGVFAMCLGAFGCQTVFGVEPFDDAPTDGAVCAGAGHDEDKDTLPDRCDRCPANADLLDPDGDGDGIGDACDPQPALACERREWFEGFGVMPASIVVAGGDWRSENDDLVQRDVSASPAVAHFPTLSVSDVFVRGAITEVELADPGTPGWVELGSGFRFATNTVDEGYGCRFLHDSTGFYAVIADESSGRYVSTMRYSGGATTASNDLQIDVDNRPGGPLTCTIVGLAPPGMATTETLETARTAGEVAILVERASAQLHWLDVIAHTCAP